MQYIGLAFDTPEPRITDLTPDVLELAQAAGYRPRLDWLEMAGDGLAAFVRSRRITRVVFLNCPSRPSRSHPTASPKTWPKAHATGAPRPLSGSWPT